MKKKDKNVVGCFAATKEFKKKGLENCSDLPFVVIMQQDFLDIYMTRKKTCIHVWGTC